MLRQRATLTGIRIVRFCCGNSKLKLPVVRELIRCVLLPSVSYAIAFARMTTEDLHQIDAVVARTLRAALGLPRHAPTLAVLVECGIPTLEAVRQCSVMRFHTRLLALPSGHPLRDPFHLDHDFKSKSAMFRSLSEEAKEYVAQHGPVPAIPVLDQALRIVKHSWLLNQQDQRHIKKFHHDVTEGLPRYLEHDDRQTAIVRARLRFNWCNINASPSIRWRLDSTACWCGQDEETPEHIVLECQIFDDLRFELQVEFTRIQVPLTLATVLGDLRGIPKTKHVQILKFSGVFLRRLRRRRWI